MNDLISRQAAIEALERKKDKNAKGDIGGFYNKIIQNDIDALMQLPSAQPERKTGRWKREVLGSTSGYGTTVMYRCSECGNISISKYEFCPNCGAKMGE